MPQELACVESVHVPKELCLSFLKLLTQRDYLIQSALITTKCFQLVYTGTELENPCDALGRGGGWQIEKKRRKSCCRGKIT